MGRSQVALNNQTCEDLTISWKKKIEKSRVWVTHGVNIMTNSNYFVSCINSWIFSILGPFTKIPKVSVTAGPVCSACEFTVGFVSTYLKKKETKAHVMANALHMCSTIPVATLADEVKWDYHLLKNASSCRFSA